MKGFRRLPSPGSRARLRRARGFTLVELIIAMAAGLLVSLGAFVLAKNATKVFQHEARISAAQLAATLGMNRLAVDLQLAGHMAPANIRTSRFRCPEVEDGIPADWPNSIKDLAAVAITQGVAATAPAQSAANDLHPDSIVIAGNFHTSEQFSVERIVDGVAGGRTVFLWTNSPEMARTLDKVATGGQRVQEIFKTGRFLRIVDKDLNQHHEYGIISGVDTSGGAIQVQLKAVPQPRKKPDDDATCGYTGFGTGTLVNPIGRVRYEIRSLVGVAPYAELVAAQADPATGDAGRTELVRVELDDEDNEMPGLELVAEYAVDLKFGITTSDLAAAPTIERHPIVFPTEDAAVYTIAGPLTTAGSAPERVRALQVRFSTRGRAPEEETDLAPGVDGRRQRFLIPGVPRPFYARMRTLYTDIELRNVVNQ